MIEFGHASHAGLCREHNEDTYWADANAGLFLVADGMGGHARGEVAAAIARDTLVDAARAGRDLEAAIRDAGTAVAACAAEAPGVSPMGTTLVVLQLEGDQFHAHCVGDSRILRWHRGQLERIDNRAAAPEPDANVDNAEPVRAPRRNRATQALGITPPSALYAEPVLGVLEPGMQFLLCSDGLTEAVAEPDIAALLARTELAAQECVDHLLLAALDAGGRDNITALLLRIA